jgi:hypothetical protein
LTTQMPSRLNRNPPWPYGGLGCGGLPPERRREA